VTGGLASSVATLRQRSGPGAGSGRTSVTAGPVAGDYCLIPADSAFTAISTSLLLSLSNAGIGFVTEFGVDGCTGSDEFGIRSTDPSGTTTPLDFTAVIP
jgi:hypothetical protein